MRVLVVGGGGREHALVWKLAQSPAVDKIFCAPGNGGIAEQARCVPVGVEDVPGLVGLTRRESVDLVVVGPEAPLVAGLADALAEAGIPVFGPRRAAAAIEGSKAFAKDLMQKYGIPTAEYRAFRDPQAAVAYARQLDGPCVVKADGLAAGKGVVVADDVPQALAALEQCFGGALGSAGQTVIIEERLSGPEVSILALTDGETVLPLLPARDHKRALDGDRGPNTGGMGAYAPVPDLDQETARRVEREVLYPTVRAMASEGRPYSGVLYAGLMLTADGPRVLEFNARFGDPETQPLLMLLASDLPELLLAVARGRLAQQRISWHAGAAACVVLASGGYPGSYRSGYPIRGLADLPPGVAAFHAGTRREEDQVVTAGGRVLCITARGADLPDALAAAYEGVKKVSFQDMHYRTDIGGRI